MTARSCFLRILSFFFHIWITVSSIWKSKVTIPQPPEFILKFIFSNRRLEILEFLSDLYNSNGFFQYEKKIYIINAKLSMKAINRLDKGSHDYLQNSPLNTSFLGASDRSPDTRHIIASIFRKSNIKHKGGVMAQVIEKTVSKMKNSKVCNLSDIILKMALDVVGQVLLAMDLQALDGNQDELLKAMMTILHRTYALGEIGPRSHEFVTATKELDKLTMDILTQSLKETSDHSSLVPQLHQVCGLEEAKSNLQLFLMAGSETTASSLPVMLDLLAKNSALQRELQQEADDWLDRLTDDVSQVPPKLESATKELLRVYAIAPFVSRKTDADIDLGEISIPAGSDLRIFIWGIHRSPTLWEDSKDYHFDRFIEKSHSAGASQSHTWMPFGAGSRVCIGQHLAWFEMRLALTYLLHNFTFYPVAETKDIEFCVDWEHAVVHPVSDVVLGIKPR